jgi:acid phosphatase type 7
MVELKSSSINRRKFVASLGLLGTAAGINPVSVLAAPSRQAVMAGDMMKCPPYLQALQSDSVVIRWITREKCYSWVEYGENERTLNKMAHCTNDGLVEANNTVNVIVLQNLQPGKKYFYRAVSKKIESFNKGKLTYGETVHTNLFSFTTPKEQRHIETVDFIVFNDIHDRPESFAALMQHQDVGRKDFVFLNGDMFNNLNTESQVVDHLLQPLTALFASEVPFIFSRGNHEARGPFARQLADYFDGREQKFYYSFQHGPLYALVLDSGEDKEDNHPEYDGIVDFDAYRLKQKAWLQAEVKKKEFRNAKFKVLFVHIPLFYNKNDEAHGAAHCREQWGSILNEAKIDLMISGHKHVYGIHPAVPGKHNYPIVIGGGPVDGRRTIINVKVNRQALHLTMKDDSGKIVGELKV